MTLEHLIVKLLNGLYRAPGRQPHGRDLVLGVTRTQDRTRTVIFNEAARPSHLAVMGLSGVGKSYLLESLIRQDIDHGTGLVLFDVHGDLADSVVAYLAEHATSPELLDRVVLVEPFDPSHSVGFNPLELSQGTSAFLQAQELAHILRSRWETRSFSPRSEELLRSALYTLSVHNLTILELPLLLTNASFRMRLVRMLAEPGIADYWRGRYEALSEPMKAVVREPLLTRVSAFVADPQIRDIIGQRKSTFSFHEAMAAGQWVIVNLSKGRLGENSAVLGSLLFTKLELDVMARARVPQAERTLFSVYADELQNLAGRNLATLVAEARKFGVSIVTGNQFWRQLSPEVRAAMLGVGSRVFFRLHYHDALELAGELHPSEKQWYVELLTRLPRGEAVFRSGAERPIPFAVSRHRRAKASPTEIETLRERCRARFAALRTIVGQDIEERYQQGPREDLSQLLERPNEVADL